MSTKKAGGSTKNGRDSKSKRLGVKIFGGQAVFPGEVIVRQRGTKFHPGKNVLRADDDTLYAKTAGTAKFLKKKMKNFTGKLVTRQYVSISLEEGK